MLPLDADEGRPLLAGPPVDDCCGGGCGHAAVAELERWDCAADAAAYDAAAEDSCAAVAELMMLVLVVMLMIAFASQLSAAAAAGLAVAYGDGARSFSRRLLYLDCSCLRPMVRLVLVARGIFCQSDYCNSCRHQYYYYCYWLVAVRMLMVVIVVHLNY